MVIVGFLIEEEANGACNRTGEFNDPFNFITSAFDFCIVFDHFFLCNLSCSSLINVRG